MAFRPPDFNLTCNVYTAANFLMPARIAGQACQLRSPQHVHEGSVSTSGAGLTFAMHLLFPVGTDIRDNFQVAGHDGIECPAGSGCQYQVLSVNDVGKGFTNEYRLAIASKTGVWPTPIP